MASFDCGERAGEAVREAILLGQLGSEKESSYREQLSMSKG